MRSQKAISSWHSPAEHKYMLTEQHIPMQEGHLPITTSNSITTGRSWSSIQARSAQQAPQMPPNQIFRSSHLALVPSKRSSRLLTPSTSSPQQQQQQQQQMMSCAVGPAKPFRPILTDQPPSDLLKDTNRHLTTHTGGHTHLDFSLEQSRVGAAMPAAPLLPLFDAANFINEPACFQLGASGSSPNPLYPSCCQHCESQAPNDFAVQICQATPAPSTLDLRQPPDSNSDQVSLVVPFKAMDPCCQQPLLHPMEHPLHSIQILHSSQQPISHHHAVPLETQQVVPQASVNASLQQMSHDVHRPHVTHNPHDGCPTGQVHDDQPSTIASQMPVLFVRSTAVRTDEEEQESTEANVAAIGTAAEGLNEGLRPSRHISISPVSR